MPRDAVAALFSPSVYPWIWSHKAYADVLPGDCPVAGVKGDNRLLKSLCP
ncbi:hypothetical protein [uncultured Coprobacter sp.]|nr:hypothetical protein [uncultured Coprobacter sp.]